MQTTNGGGAYWLLQSNQLSPEILLKDDIISESQAKSYVSHSCQTWSRRSTQGFCATKCSFTISCMISKSWNGYLLKDYTDQYEIACDWTRVRGRTIPYKTCRVIWCFISSCSTNYGRKIGYVLPLGGAPTLEPRTTEKSRGSWHQSPVSAMDPHQDPWNGSHQAQTTGNWTLPTPLERIWPMGLFMDGICRQCPILQPLT